MKSIAIAWHWLTTSRYTRFLEVELERTRKENESLARDVDALICQIYPQFSKARKDAAKTDKAELPASFNWQRR